jgi:hypothetical protein
MSVSTFYSSSLLKLSKFQSHEFKPTLFYMSKLLFIYSFKFLNFGYQGQKYKNILIWNELSKKLPIFVV